VAIAAVSPARYRTCFHQDECIASDLDIERCKSNACKVGSSKCCIIILHCQLFKKEIATIKTSFRDDGVLNNSITFPLVL
jgi:hypothetical protein